MAELKLVDKAVLKTLVPPSALNAENFQELAGKAYVEEVPAGKVIFKAGDVDRKTTYLLEGDVALTSDKGQTTTVTGGSNLAKHPIAHHQPRQRPARLRASTAICSISS